MTETSSGRSFSAMISPLTGAAGQAAVVGVGTLIPTRRYPRWLRGTIIWAPALLTAGAIAVPGAVEEIGRRLRDGEPADRSDDDGEGARDEGSEAPSQASTAAEPSRSRLANGALRLGAGVGAGALMYGLGRFGFWADTAVESGLRRLRVPTPRVVMAVGAGALTARTAKQQELRPREAQ